MLTFLVASTLPGVAAPTAGSSSGAPAPRKFDSAAWGQLSSLVPPPHASLHPLVQRGERSGGRPCGHSQAHGDGGVPAGHRPAEHTTSGDEARGAGGGRGWRHRWWLVPQLAAVQQRARHAVNTPCPAGYGASTTLEARRTVWMLLLSRTLVSRRRDRRGGTHAMPCGCTWFCIRKQLRRSPGDAWRCRTRRVAGMPGSDLLGELPVFLV